jgi:hypothetical protein
MTDTGNSGNHLESEIAALDGVLGAVVLRDPDGTPAEVQIFSSAGASAARIRKGVSDILARHEHTLPTDAISVFELTGDAATGAVRPATAAVTATASMVPPAQEIKPAEVSTPRESEPTPPTRAVPVGTLVTSLFVIVGLVLLLTAPWVALVRLVSEPLQTGGGGTGARVATDSAGGGRRMTTPIVAPPVTPAAPTIVAQPPPTTVTTPRSSRVPPIPTLVQAPTSAAAPVPLSPVPATTTTATAPSSTTSTASTLPPTEVPSITDKPTAFFRAATKLDDDDEESDDDGKARGHAKHHLRDHPGKGIGLKKHRHLEAVLPESSARRDDDGDDEDEDD